MGQFTDGLFQSALASFVLFSPERQPSAQTAALAFSVVLLPYSLIGPFVGTLLDRFSRQRIVFGSNLFRAITLIFIATLISNGVTGVELTIFVLVAFGVNRLILAGLSAGLPLLVDKKQLICGTILNSSIKFSDKFELSSKYDRLSSHLGIDDKANSLRIIEELLLLVSINLGLDNEEYRFLE